MTVYALPSLLVDGQPLDPARVILPLEYGYGRQNALQQPDPGGCQFDWLGAPPFQVGSVLEVWLEGECLWRGEITANPATWETADSIPVHSITGTGWAYRLARTFARAESWLPAGTEAEQIAAALAAFASASDPEDPPITTAQLTEPAELSGTRVQLAAPLWQTLGELGAETGAAVWESADGVQYVGAAGREYAPAPAASLPAELITMPLDYTESAVLNRVTITYGIAPQDSDGTTQGVWRWRAGTAQPTAGELYWNAATQQLLVHELDDTGANQRLNLLNAIEGQGVFILSPSELRKLQGLIDGRSITGQVFTLQLVQTQTGTAGLPTNNQQCSLSLGAPSGLSLLVVDDLPSQDTYGPQEVKLDTRYTDTAGAGPRANRLLRRWRNPRWLQELTVDLQLPSDRATFDAVLHARPNDSWRLEGISSERPGAGAGLDAFIEGTVHSWDRSTTGAPIARATWAVTPRAVWTRLAGYGWGPYGNTPYGGTNE